MILRMRCADLHANSYKLKIIRIFNSYTKISTKYRLHHKRCEKTYIGRLGGALARSLSSPANPLTHSLMKCSAQTDLSGSYHSASNSMYNQNSYMYVDLSGLALNHVTLL